MSHLIVPKCKKNRISKSIELRENALRGRSAVQRRALLSSGPTNHFCRCTANEVKNCAIFGTIGVQNNFTLACPGTPERLVGASAAGGCDEAGVIHVAVVVQDQVEEKNGGKLGNRILQGKVRFSPVLPFPCARDGVGWALFLRHYASNRFNGRFCPENCRYDKRAFIQVESFFWRKQRRCHHLLYEPR